MILTVDDLALLTGRRRPSAQRRVLDALGIRYRMRPDRSLVVFAHDISGHEATTDRQRPPRLRLPQARGDLAGQKREVDPAGINR
jgi:hypothetical protein